MLQQKYKYIDYISEGIYGKVFRYLDINTNTEVAIKKVKLEYGFQDFNEIIITTSIIHPNIVRTLDYFIEENYIYIIQELGIMDLLHYYEKNSINKDQLEIFFNHIFNGIICLYSNHIVHGDIKLDNMLLFKDNVVKLCDFGLSINNFVDKSTIVYAENRKPNEVKERNIVSRRSDFWVLGTEFLELLKESGEQLDSNDLFISFLLELTEEKLEKRKNMNQLLNHSYFSNRNIPKWEISIYNDQTIDRIKTYYENNYIEGINIIDKLVIILKALCINSGISPSNTLDITCKLISHKLLNEEFTSNIRNSGQILELETYIINNIKLKLDIYKLLESYIFI